MEGTSTSPVGYLEGIFVKEEYRHKGYAKELLAECEKWAKEKGCKEFASDCEIDNMRSFDFHMAMGFTEANQSNDILWCTWRIFFATGKITYTAVFKFEEDESVKI